MTKFGLDCLFEHFPSLLKGKRVGIVCHAATINARYEHIIEIFARSPECHLSAIFGPQHGIYGQTQDNMIEWEGTKHPQFGIPVYSLYGKTRKPTPEMLSGLDALIFDIQDVGARPYTYIWTLKLCMEACSELSIPLWVLDRPNPIGCVPFDGPMLDPEYFSFVGGAQIPLCHRLTMGEMAMLIRSVYHPRADLHVVWMENWWRNSLWSQTGLPWVLPSPNMPTLDTAVVYPGMVLLEATNVSEGRGTTRPFEIFGAPFMDISHIVKRADGAKLKGFLLREHGFIPTFQKWAGHYCNGMQIHVLSPREYLPVTVTALLLSAIIESSQGQFKFKDPPYEYETVKMPFDILSGDTTMREALQNGANPLTMREKWVASYGSFNDVFKSIAQYPEELQ